MRINQFLSSVGFCSRREADKLVAEGRVRINKKTAVNGDQVQPTYSVYVDGVRVNRVAHHHYLAFHKPVGVVCTTDTSIKGNIIDFLKYSHRIFPIGRLDKDSEGLILLTSDGTIVNDILRAEHGHQKQYRLTLNKPIKEEDLEHLRTGVRIFNPVKEEYVVTNPSVVERLSPSSFDITITQGLNRQLRRMCEALGYEVRSLKRTRIMHVKLGKLPLGHYRHLTKEEIAGLRIKPQNSKPDSAKPQNSKMKKKHKRKHEKMGK